MVMPFVSLEFLGGRNNKHVLNETNYPYTEFFKFKQNYWLQILCSKIHIFYNRHILMQKFTTWFNR